MAGRHVPYRWNGWHFKEKDPNVPIEVLWDNWVEDADILYIGKAGGVSKNGVKSNSTLKRRIIELLRFGNGKKVGHWGGRYLWQHEKSKDFRVYWYVCKNGNPTKLEKELILDFYKAFGKKPFANLTFYMTYKK